jgi:hypothetical protein
MRVNVTNQDAHEITRLALELDTARLRAWGFDVANSPAAKEARATLARAEVALDEAVTRLKESSANHHYHKGAEHEP